MFIHGMLWECVQEQPDCDRHDRAPWTRHDGEPEGGGEASRAGQLAEVQDDGGAAERLHRKYVRISGSETERELHGI